MSQPMDDGVFEEGREASGPLPARAANRASRFENPQSPSNLPFHARLIRRQGKSVNQDAP